MSKLCNFGKEIKKRLVDIDKNQEWLITEVRADTGLYRNLLLSALICFFLGLVVQMFFKFF